MHTTDLNLALHLAPWAEVMKISSASSHEVISLLVSRAKNLLALRSRYVTLSSNCVSRSVKNTYGIQLYGDTSAHCLRNTTIWKSGWNSFSHSLRRLCVGEQTLPEVLDLSALTELESISIETQRAASQTQELFLAPSVREVSISIKDRAGITLRLHVHDELESLRSLDICIVLDHVTKVQSAGVVSTQDLSQFDTDHLRYLDIIGLCSNIGALCFPRLEQLGIYCTHEKPLVVDRRVYPVLRTVSNRYAAIILNNPPPTLRAIECREILTYDHSFGTDCCAMGHLLREDDTRNTLHAEFPFVRSLILFYTDLRKYPGNWEGIIRYRAKYNTLHVVYDDEHEVYFDSPEPIEMISTIISTIPGGVVFPTLAQIAASVLAQMERAGIVLDTTCVPYLDDIIASAPMCQCGKLCARRSIIKIVGWRHVVYLCAECNG